MISPQENLNIYWHDPNKMKNLFNRWNSSNYWIQTIFEDRSGTFWLGTSGGLVEFDIKNSSYLLYKSDPLKTNNLSNNYVNTIFEDDKGQLWIGTQRGLNIFDRKTGLFNQLYHDPNDPSSLSGNIIDCIYHERSGNTLDRNRCWAG